MERSGWLYLQSAENRKKIGWRERGREDEDDDVDVDVDVEAEADGHIEVLVTAPLG